MGTECDSVRLRSEAAVKGGVKMKKSIWKILLLACFAAIVFMPQKAMAEEKTVDWEVVFTAAGEMGGNFDAKAVNDVIAGMQPGDQVNFKVNFKNEYNKETDWYLKNDVIKSLEDSAKAAKAGGGAYTYKLTYTDQNTGKATVLFDSEKVGGDSTTGGQGLHKATTSLKGWEYVGTHKKGGKGGLVELVVGLDGETQGNRYQDTVADIELQFGVWIPSESDSPDKPNKTYSSKTSGTNRVKTGDQPFMMKYVLLALAGIVLLVLALLSRRLGRRENSQPAGRNAGRRD